MAGELVERAPTQIIHIAHYKEAKRLFALHSKINPGSEATFEDIYASVLKLAQHRADEDADARPKVLRKKARRKT